MEMRNVKEEHQVKI